MKKKQDEVTTVEAASLLGVSVRTTQRWAESIIDRGVARPRGAEVELRTARRGAGGFYVLSKAELQGLADLD